MLLSPRPPSPLPSCCLRSCSPSLPSFFSSWRRNRVLRRRCLLSPAPRPLRLRFSLLAIPVLFAVPSFTFRSSGRAKWCTDRQLGVCALCRPSCRIFCWGSDWNGIGRIWRMVQLSENEGIDGRTFMVTGGAGHVGSLLCLELARRGAAEVRSFDLCNSQERLALLKQHGVKCIIGDVRRRKDVEKAIRNADCVFHMASFGMSGKEMLQSRHIDEVNLDGTCHVLDCCAKSGVRRLVYTSTYNVVYGGQEIRNGTENLPYFPVEKHVDPYGRSKALAEQLVIRSNGRPLTDRKGKKLYTCAIRPGSIYGPGEERHLPRILKMARMGLLKFRIGGPNVLTDWVYADNLVHAHLLASMALIDDLPGRSGLPPAAGQAYFISDGAPVNSFDLIRPIVEGVGYTMPQREISVKSAVALAWCIYAFYGLLYPWLRRSWIPEPFLLPAEVFKVGVTHYCSTWKARQEIGYTAIVDKKDALDRTVTYWKERHAQELDGPPLLTWVLLLGGFVLLFLCVYVPAPFMGPLECVRWFGLLIFRSREVLSIILYLALFAHLVEGVYAWMVAMKADRKNAHGWFWQTLALGYPSLQYLLRRAEKKKFLKKT